LDKTPIRIKFQSSIEVESPIELTVEPDVSLIFRIPQLENEDEFTLVWKEQNEVLKGVEDFSGSLFEYKRLDPITFALPSILLDEGYEEVTIKVENSEADSKFNHSDYFLTIYSPNSTYFGYEQPLPEKRNIVIPADGDLKLELAPSVLTHPSPIDRYKVEYYHKDNPREPIDTQYWVVPETPIHRITRLLVPYPPYAPIPLPGDFYGLASIAARSYPLNTLRWSVGWNYFNFLPDWSPPPDYPFDLEYQPAVSLDQLLLCDQTDSLYGSRWI
jgi:hypothetical protein